MLKRTEFKRMRKEAKGGKAKKEKRIGNNTRIITSV